MSARQTISSNVIESAQAPSAKLRFKLASFLGWSDRLVDMAVTAYESLFRLNHRDAASIHLQIGSDLRKERRYEAALDALNTACTLNPDDSQIWFELGLVQLGRGDAGGAIGAFEEAKTLGETSFDLYYHYGVALSASGDYASAVDELISAVQIDPESAEAFHRLGVALDKIDAFEEAIEAFERAIQISPREPTYYQSLGFTLESAKRPEEAIAALKRAVELERQVEYEGKTFGGGR